MRGAAGQDDTPGQPGSGPLAARRLARQRAVAEAFIAASRAGDRDALLAVLDPDVVLHADAAAAPSAGRRSCGARRRWPTGRGCPASGQGTRSSSSWTGCPASCTRRGGKVEIVLAFSYRDDRISGIEVIADPDRLDALELAVLG